MVKRWLILTTLVLGLDQAIKFLVISKEADYVVNQGIAWGLGKELSWQLIIILLLIGLMIWSKWVWPSALVIGGGLGNLIDRLIRGGVIDYINWLFLPSFNMADVMITIGAIIWIIKEFYGTKSDI